MEDIEALRDRMDEVTAKMVRLLKERNDIAGQIGRVKRSIGKGVTDGAREDALRAKMAALCGEIGLDESVGARFLNLLLNESVSVQSLGKKTHLSIFRRAKELEQEGRRIIHMEVGEPDFDPPRQAAGALSEACAKGICKYGPPEGMPELRDALAKHASAAYGASVARENVMVVPGARFAVFAAATTLLNPGDEVIVIEPAWPAYRECALHAGAKVRAIHTTLEEGWEPDAAEVKAAINGNTRMLALNYPNNPTGKVLPKALQDELVGIARDNGLYVLSDEIYASYSESFQSVLGYGYERAIVLQSFSKSHAMTGFRVGYAISSPATVARMASLAALCLTSVPEPMQHAALAALGADVSHNSNTVQKRLGVLAQRARGMGLDFAEPDGAMYLFARVGKAGLDGTRLAESLLERGLAIAPGEGFGDYGDYIRISACQDEKTLIEGMDMLDGEVNGTR